MLRNDHKKRNMKREKKFRLRLAFRKKFTFLNVIFQIAPYLKRVNLTTTLNFRITQNNIFCTLKNIVDNKVVEIGSAGKYKVKFSKKTLRHNTKILIGIFLKKVKMYLRKRFVLIDLIGPLRVRKPMLKQIFEQIGIKTCITANVNPKKCFNGCRPKKKRRKKQKSLRLFK